MNSEVEATLNDRTLRGIRLLRKTSLRGLALDMPHTFSPDPVKQRIVRLAGTKYHWERGRRTSTLCAVYFLKTDLGILNPKWKDPKRLLIHARAQINRAALKLYKQYTNEQKRILASFSDPLDTVNYVVTDYIHESSVTYQRFANPGPTIRQDQLAPKQRRVGKSKYF